MLARFWGTRGSLPSPGPATIRYGGNTSCVEIRDSNGTLLILDCGTGARALGASLLGEAKGAPIRGHLLIGHTHWDHIQGLPFFAPLFIPGHEWDIYAPRGFDKALRETLSGQMQYAYFPVALDQLGATIRYHDLIEGKLRIGGIRVIARYLNHPALTLGYRLEADGASIVYATDHEPHGRNAALGEGDLAHPEDAAHIDFLSDADVLIHDCQYTASEYPSKAGWGHSTVEYVVDVAIKAGVKKLILFHHDPTRTDEAVDRIVEAAKARAFSQRSNIDIVGAQEGETLHVEAPEPRGPMSSRSDTAHTAISTKTLPKVLLAIADDELSTTLHQAVSGDRLLITHHTNEDQAYEHAANESPTLILVDEKAGGLRLIKRLRQELDGEAKNIPIIATGKHCTAEEAFQAGATDSLIPPFSRQYARTKLRAWLMRARARWTSAPLSANERDRVNALNRLGVVALGAEERFDRIIRLTARAFDVPLALLSFIDSEKQYLKSRISPSDTTGPNEVPRDVSLCAHTLSGQTSLVVEDATVNEMFSDHPYFQPDPPWISGIDSHMPYRFYAGVSIRSPEGHRIGALCIMDKKPRTMREPEMNMLGDLALLIEDELRKQ